MRSVVITFSPPSPLSASGVEGAVTFAGQPLAGANIRMGNDGVTTDDEGKYELPSSASGQLELSVPGLEKTYSTDIDNVTVVEFELPPIKPVTKIPFFRSLISS